MQAWWHDPLDLEGVRAKYGPRIDGRVPTRVLLMSEGEQPVGFIQWYLWRDYPEHASRLGAAADEAGIDLAIGEPDRLGRGLGSGAIAKLVTEVLFADPRIAGCVSDPEARNVRSVRAFERAGFDVTATVRLPGESVLRCVVRRRRRAPGSTPSV